MGEARQYFFVREKGGEMLTLFLILALVAAIVLTWRTASFRWLVGWFVLAVVLWGLVWAWNSINFFDDDGGSNNEATRSSRPLRDTITNKPQGRQTIKLSQRRCDETDPSGVPQKVQGCNP